MKNWVNDFNYDENLLSWMKHLSKKEIQRIVAEKFEYFSSLIKYSKNSWLTMRPFQPSEWEEWTFACWLWEEGNKLFSQFMDGKIQFSEIPEEYFEPKYLYYWLPRLISKWNDVLWPIVDHELEHAESSDYWDMLMNSREAILHNLPVTTVWMFFNAFEDIYMGKKQIARWRAKKLWVQNLYKDMYKTTGTLSAKGKLLKLEQFANKVIYHRLCKEFPITFDVDYIVDDDVQEEFDNFIEHLEEIVDTTIDNKDRVKKKNQILWPIIERLGEKDMDKLQRERIKQQIQQERREQQGQQLQETQESTQEQLKDTLKQQESKNWQAKEWDEWKNNWEQWESKNPQNWNENEWTNNWEWNSEDWENQNSWNMQWQGNEWKEGENGQNPWWNKPWNNWSEGECNQPNESGAEWWTPQEWNEWNPQNEWSEWAESSNKGTTNKSQWTNIQWNQNSNWKVVSETNWNSELQQSRSQSNNSWQSGQATKAWHSAQSAQWWSDQQIGTESEWQGIYDEQLEKEIQDRLNNMSEAERNQMIEDIKNKIDQENLREHWEDLRMQKKLLEQKEDSEKNNNTEEWNKENASNEVSDKEQEHSESWEKDQLEEMQKQWEEIEKAVEKREEDLFDEKKLGEYLDKLEEMSRDKDLDKMEKVEEEYEKLLKEAENVESEDVRERLKEKIKWMRDYLKNKEKDYEEELRKSWFSREEEYLYKRYMKIEKELNRDVERFIKHLEAEIPKLKEYHLEWWYNSWRVTDMNDAWRKIKLKQWWEKLYSRYEEKESLEVNLWICLSIDVSWSMEDNIADTMRLVIFLWLLCQKWWIPFHVNTFWSRLTIIKDTDDEFESRKWALMRQLVADDWSTNISLSVKKDLDVIKEVEKTHPDTVFLPIFVTDWDANAWIRWNELIELMKWFNGLSTVVGIGINENQLKRWYPNSQVISLRDSSEIMSTLLRELRQFFKKHKSKIFKAVTE